MLVTRKCDRAKGFGVRVDLDVTSDGKSIIISLRTTISDNSVGTVSKEEAFQMWMRRRVSRDAILDLEWRIRVLLRCTGTRGSVRSVDAANMGFWKRDSARVGAELWSCSDVTTILAPDHTRQSGCCITTMSRCGFPIDFSD
jgi:hypothetical protein